MPPGDLLIHTGDVVGNYGEKHDILSHFRSFLEWLHVGSQSYAKVVFIGGNHDTLLDNDVPEYAVRAENIGAQKLLSDFLAQHPTVSYLENSATTYLSLFALN